MISKNEKGKDRQFDENELMKLWNIRVLVSIGFTLDEVKEIMGGKDLNKIIEDKLKELRYKYRDLKGKINFLNILKMTGKIPHCFDVVTNEFEKIYDLGLTQYASPFDKESDIWNVLEMLILLHHVGESKNQSERLRKQ